MKAGVPNEVSVLVLADRGIGCSPHLCRVIERLGWRYLFGLTCQTKIVVEDQEYVMTQQAREGEIGYQSGKVFKKRGLIPAHVRVVWDGTLGVVTHDEALTGYEYARRNWQAQSFRDLKSDDWHWGESRLRCPAHTEQRLIL